MKAPERNNWIASLTGQIHFYEHRSGGKRSDPEFEWDTLERSFAQRHPRLRALVRSFKKMSGLHVTEHLSTDWLHDHADLLYDARCMLDDDLSRLLFDAAITVRLAGYRQFYFPRIDFDDFLTIESEKPFREKGFPHDYLGAPLGVFDIRLCERAESPTVRVITRAIQLRLVNSYRQYLIRRSGFDISPRSGETVYDCGACIGEISVLFAGMVAGGGEVHLFDPMPLHTRFCKLQASLNPTLQDSIHVNTLAVGDSTHEGKSGPETSDQIEPGAISTADFACTTLDDYSAKQDRPVDFIKMDIEGAEMAALNGASGTISSVRPRLAISGYHKPEDLWELPNKIKDLNPRYKMAFGHHTPIMWESVFYAWDDGKQTRVP